MSAQHADRVLVAYGANPDPVVEPHRQSEDGQWAFGGGYFPIPPEADHTTPVTALFIARRSGSGWEVALEDTPRFAELAAEAPEGVVSGSERKVFAARQVNVRARLDATPQLATTIGLGLPFQKNGAAWGHSGVHGDSGSSTPYNAIDFWGGDGRVLASRGGIAYKFCTNSRWPYIKVVHDNGWTTGYYHLKNQATISNGQYLAEGAFIGMIGVELPCGGRASGDHLHWSLWRGNQSGAAEAVHGKVIGGWTWFQGSQPYSGYAERNGVRVNTYRSGLINYGSGDTSTPPPGTEPCSGTGCSKYTGSFSAAGQVAFHPGSGGFSHTGGTLKGWLKGAAGTDYDLILGRYNASTGQWDRVAAADGPSSDESLTYEAPAGTYRWRINAYSGSGSYTLWTQR